MKKIVFAALLFLLLPILSHAEEKNWFVGAGFPWYGHSVYAKQPVLIAGWQNKDYELKYMDFGKIATRRTMAIRGGLKFDPLIFGIQTSYNHQWAVTDSRWEAPKDNINRTYVTWGPYFGFQVDRPRYTISWTYYHSVIDEDCTTHAEIVEVLFKF